MWPGVHAQQRPYHPAVVLAGSGAVVTYGELEDRSVRLARVWGGPRTTVETMRTRLRAYWTTSLAPGAVYSTRWTLATGASAVYRTGV